MIEMFMNFMSSILDFEIFNIKLIDILIAITIIVFIFKILEILGNRKGD